MMAKLRPWHVLVVTLATVTAVLLVWFAVAYGGLPRLWSRHEHKRIDSRSEIVAYTAQDIPADPINLRLSGTAEQIACAMTGGGWVRADAVSGRSAVKIAASVILHRPYPAAPVSPLYVRDRMQDMAFEKDEGKSADKRHHVRFWQIAPGDWLAAATFDRGVGLSLFTLQVTHYIGPDPDADRAMVGAVLQAAGAQRTGMQASRIPPGRWRRNGGGNRYRTDGMIWVYRIGASGGSLHRRAPRC